MVRLFSTISLVLIIFSGCAHVISKDILGETDTGLTFDELRKSPALYQGRTVLLGGVIVKTANKKEGTLLEVYQTTTDRRGKPIRLDMSGGRFLALYEGLLESEIYRKGRKVTIAGIVHGEKVMRLGEMDYHYPYLVVREIHLWEEERRPTHELYPWDLWGPWWWHPWYPWHDPCWRCW